MRLSDKEVEIIKKSILNIFDDAQIILFGSRVYDDKRGGDIDIYVETNYNSSLSKKIKILSDMEINGIFRKVDLIIKTKDTKYKSIFDTIKKEGILL